MTSPPGQGLGKGMIIAAWVLLLFLLTLFFGRVLEQRENPNSIPGGSVSGQGVREVVLERNAQGHYVASGAINGHPVVFLVDTGATDVAVSEALAERLGLKKHGGAFSHTANGVVAVWQTTLHRVSLGVIEMHNLRATILPDLKPSNQVLLGMSFLKKLELIQRNGVLTLRQLP
ncbi:MAG TPA: TIGR02281 family clan AA aspartic protease [Chromatiaceae bacterium]|nr:TIGR02281 family clan AA aspartic protease [Chromatiaceae bacterium]